MAIAETTLPGVLKMLADPTRLRILALLEREELSVGELSRTLGMAQSRVSNHLRTIRETELLAERHAGVSTFLKLHPARNGATAPSRIWSALRDELAHLPEHAADLVRLEAVLAERRDRDDFFDRVADEWDKIAGGFGNGQARLRGITHLLPTDYTVADLGCGTGYMAEPLLDTASRVICVDQSERMLEEAKKRLLRRGHAESVEFRVGDLDRLPLDDGEVDGVLAGMVLHHLPEPGPALTEMHRVVKPGGTAVILELAPHRETWMRAELGDRHLGLEASDVMVGLRRAGFEDVALDPSADTYRPPHPDGRVVSLPLYIARGRKPR